MAFIKARNIALISLTMILLGGCASWSKSDKISPELDPDDAAWQPSPNPYLQQSTKVSAQVRAQFQQALEAIGDERWREAETELQALTQQHPTLSGPWVNLGIVYWRQNQREEAEQAFAQAIETNPLNNDAYIQYAVLLREQGRFEEAQALYLKALDVWPHSPLAHRNLGILYDLYMGEMHLAMEHYEMALKIAGESNRELEGWIIDLRRRMGS